jgi:hypothetical protein
MRDGRSADESSALESDQLVSQLIEAYTSRAWIELGYSSWREYIAGEYSVQQTRMPAPRRKTAVAAMASAGMSARAMGVALGVDHMTAYLDLVGRARPTSEGVRVYLIGSQEFRPVKIGKGYPRERLTPFQVGSPFLLEVLWTVPGSASLERALQDRFTAFRIRGEWFEFPEGSDPVQLVSCAAADLM